MNKLRSYSSPYNLGHKALDDFFDGNPVVLQEKIDGSQFSFGVVDGELFCRSRNQQIDLSDPPKMFMKGIETVELLFQEGRLKEGWTYRGEYLSKPKHNTLAYGRVPKNHIILFDVDTGHQHYLKMEGILKEAHKLDLEVVPFFKEMTVLDLDYLKSLMDMESILGEVKIEGVVLKNYSKFDVDKKVLMAKFVSEDFREKHSTSWKKRNLSQTDFVRDLGETYCTEARFKKAVQHLEEQGELEHSPKDIGLLMRELHDDLEKEWKEEIQDKLYKHFRRTILKEASKGAPEWYKRQLVEMMKNDKA